MQVLTTAQSPHRYVCLAELLPAAFLEKGVSKDLVTAAFFGGCLMMASSLVIEKFATEGSAEYAGVA